MNRDFNDLLSAFNAQRVEYLVVGAHALADFGAPVQGLTEDDLSRPGLIFQIGVAPLRIDVITEIDGVEFATAWSERMSAHFGDTEVSVLSRRHLITNKRASGRLQDLADVERLEHDARDQRPR